MTNIVIKVSLANPNKKPKTSVRNDDIITYSLFWKRSSVISVILFGDCLPFFFW